MSKILTYRYVSDYATIVFDVEGDDDWPEEQFDSASEFDLECYAKNHFDYSLDDCWDREGNNV